MNNGCICCSVRGDLIRILGRLLKRKDRLDGVLIETTGLANPAPVAQTFFTDDEMRAAFRLDAIVAVVDARHISTHLDAGDESVKQIAFADVILLNKTDLAPPAGIQALERRIRGINSVAGIIPCINCEVPLGRVLNVGGFNLARAGEIDPGFLERERPFEWAGAYALPAGVHALEIGHCGGDGHEHGGGAHHHHHGNQDELDVVILPVAPPTPEAPESLPADSVGGAEAEAERLYSGWETRLGNGETATPGPSLYRLLLKDGCGRFPLDIPSAGQFIVFEQCGEHPLHITAGGEIVRPGWQRDYHAAHEHDGEVGSVGIRQPGELDGKRLNDWISNLLRTKGGDIYRMKGVLNIQGTDKRLVFQGVHMLFDARFDRPWGSEQRMNTLVFIGKRLDRADITAAFQACLAD
jgi:G3E family GTPase